ncbi:hypothetical protein HK097_001425 [Rhizophlyctis rosea]|uniref:D-arabinitol 2-dehydrogenase [ribulose-forming] n=1 Tax=Rhizophlyctis rosea TaxID=64517 RepID=A0AAD5X1C2_9FUNG|nr:hypothetical protein HK097_001425 [Rhizophlyctis rosea]
MSPNTPADTLITPSSSPAPGSLPTLPSGRTADTPLEVIACHIRSILKSNDIQQAHLYAQKALELTEGIDNYIEEMTSVDAVGEEIHEVVKKTMEWDWDGVYEKGQTKYRQTSNCCAGTFEAAFISTFAQSIRAKTVLEIGMFTGTTTMAVASVLPTDGKIYTLDIEPYLKEFTKPHFEKAGLDRKIEVLLGDGKESLRELSRRGVGFDMIFIDADKTGYRGYYDAIMELGLLNVGGSLLVDNTLFKGKYFDQKPNNPDPNAEALRLFNHHIKSDPRTNSIVLPIRDGVTLIVRRPASPSSTTDVVLTGLNRNAILNRLSLNSKVALVTGAGQGIGRAFAHALGEAGAAVAVVDLNLENAEKVVGELRGKGVRAIAVRADVTRKEDCENMVTQTITQWGRLDIAVNNAGINFNSPAESTPENEWDLTFNVNTKGVFLSCQAEAKHMLASSTPCSIINTASMATLLVPRPQKQAAYNASKAAVVKLTQTLGVEWADRNIRVNCISPGIVNTALIHENPALKPLVGVWLDQIPLGRLAEVTDLQAAVVYLASEASGYMTGQNVAIEGGQSVV